MAENLVDSIGVSPVCHTRILLAHAEALASDIANLALGALNGEEPLVLLSPSVTTLAVTVTPA